MNIAFCFSGQLRQFDISHKTFLSSVLGKVSGAKCFFFGHAPNDDDACKAKVLDFTELSIEDEPPLDEKYKKIQHAIAFRKWHGDSLRAYIMQLRSVKLANDLKTKFEQANGITFDWVFRMRWDNLYLTDLEDISGLDNRYMYIPAHDNWWGYNDRFAFSSSANMDIYAGRIDLVLDYIAETRKPLHCEMFTKWALDKAGIEIRRTQVIHALLRYNELYHPRSC
jgi:hypothetical protein